MGPSTSRQILQHPSATIPTTSHMFFNGVQHPTCSVFGSSSNHEEVFQSSYAFIMNDCTYQDAFAHSILKNVTILLPKRLYHPTPTIPSTSHSIVGATFKLTSIPSTSYMVEVGVATSHQNPTTAEQKLKTIVEIGFFIHIGSASPQHHAD